MCELNGSINNSYATDHANKKRQDVYQPEDPSKKLLEAILATQERINYCLNDKGLSFLVSNEPLWMVMTGLANKGKE
jgi:hypothetical protein